MLSPKARHYSQLLHRQMAKLRDQQQSLSEERQAQQDFAELALRLPPDVQVEDGELAGRPGKWVVPKRLASFAWILFLHGGAYQTGSPKTHLNLAVHLAVAAGHRLWLPDYRLAPEHPFPAALDDALAAYRALADQRQGAIALAGDSAGGGLALATALRLRDARQPLAGLALLSPWTDLTLSGASHQSRAHLDPYFPTPAGLAQAAQRYAQSQPLDHPEVSPLFADFTDLPPLCVHVGDHETLLDDSVELVRRAQAAGVAAQLKIWPELWHVWQSYAGRLPESDQSLAELGAFLRQRLLEQ